MSSQFQALISSSLALMVGLGLSIALSAPKAKAALTMNGVRLNGIALENAKVRAVKLNHVPIQRIGLDGGQVILHLKSQDQ